MGNAEASLAIGGCSHAERDVYRGRAGACTGLHARSREYTHICSRNAPCGHSRVTVRRSSYRRGLNDLMQVQEDRRGSVEAAEGTASASVNAFLRDLETTRVRGITDMVTPVSLASVSYR